MGTTGVIFAAIAVAWLAYLIPHFVRHRDGEPGADSDPADRFSDSVRVLRHGTAPLVDQDLTEIERYVVSTPMTRRAAINDLRRGQRLAARRRRRTLVVILVLLSAAVAASALGLVPWWSVAGPGVLLVGFVVAARIGVTVMNRQMGARYAAIRRGGSEDTILLTRSSVPLPEPSSADGSGATAMAVDGALWEPVPITMPTYVSKPLAPRTVRTIDLSGPAIVANGAVPVTADPPPATVVREVRERPGAARDDRAASA